MNIVTETWPADWWHPFLLLPFYVAIAATYLWYWEATTPESIKRQLERIRRGEE